jgi:outer membrane protein OmpA-like peptidoglycan-associated protein
MRAVNTKWMIAMLLPVALSMLAGCRIQPGTTKAPIQNLLGPPHFNEGVWAVREWDYLFNFRQNGGVITCEYKVLFDHDHVAHSIYWSPDSCAALLAPPPMAVQEAPPPVLKEPLRLSADALFDFNRAELKPEGREQLSGLLQQLRAASQVEQLRITGYTDRIGSDSYNLALSQRRAESVRDYLAANGVPADAMQVEGRGKADPVAECPDGGRRADLIACLAPNRRVEISGIAK